MARIHMVRRKSHLERVRSSSRLGSPKMESQGDALANLHLSAQTRRSNDEEAVGTVATATCQSSFATARPVAGPVRGGVRCEMGISRIAVFEARIYASCHHRYLFATGAAGL